MSDDYKVGYKNPPRKYQFKEGQSGNRKGRPKGARNLKTDLLEELGERILIREGNREVRMSKQRALIKSQLARALKGSDRAASKIIDLCLRVIGIEDEAADADTPLTAEEQAVLAALKTRILRKAGVAEPVNGTENDEEEKS